MPRCDCISQIQLICWFFVSHFLRLQLTSRSRALPPLTLDQLFCCLQIRLLHNLIHFLRLRRMTKRVISRACHWFEQFLTICFSQRNRKSFEITSGPKNFIDCKPTKPNHCGCFRWFLDLGDRWSLCTWCRSEFFDLWQEQCFHGKVVVLTASFTSFTVLITLPWIPCTELFEIKTGQVMY